MKRNFTIGTQERIVEFLTKHPEPHTISQIRKALSMDYYTIMAVLDRLKSEGIAEKTQIKKVREGWRLK